MKNIIPLFIIASIFTSCFENTPVVKTPPTQQETKVVAQVPTKIEMTIEGMMCEMGCAAKIEKKLNTNKAIVTAKVNFESKKAEVIYDQSLINPLDIKALIEGLESGYQVIEYQLDLEP